MLVPRSADERAFARAIKPRGKPPKVRQGKAKGATIKPSLPYPGFKTRAQLEAEARAAVTSAVSPSRLAIERAQRDAQARALAQAAQIRGFSEALANLLKGYAPQVQGLYQQAAGTQGQLAQGFSGGLRDTAASSAAQANATIAAAGGTPGQQITPTAADQAANVLYGLGGYLPGNMLGAQGAAFASAAALMPATAMGRGQQLLQQALAQAAEEQQGLSEKLLDLSSREEDLYLDQLERLKAQQSGLRDDYLDYQAELAKSRRLDVSASKLLGYLVDQAGRPIRNRKGKVQYLPGDDSAWQIVNTGSSGVYRVNSRTGAAQVIVPPQPGRSALKVTGSDRSGRFLYDPQTGKVYGQVTPPITPSSGGGSRGGGPYPPASRGGTGQPRDTRTAAAKREDRQLAATIATSAWKGVNPDGQPVPRLTYQQALQKMMRDYDIPLADAQRALNKYWYKGAKGPGGMPARVVDGFVLMPWEKPGEGRPLVPIQKRGKADAAGQAALPAPTAGYSVASGNVAQVTPQALQVAKHFGLTVTSGYRSVAEQQAIYARRSTSGSVAKPGNSLHQHGRGVDVAPNANALRFAAWAKQHPEYFQELFFDPLGWYIKNGKIYRGAIGGHRDHLHYGVWDA